MPRPTEIQVGDFYVRLGMTVAAWQFVETSLIHIYASAVRATQYNALAASFHTPASFRARLDMTNEAVEHSDLDANLKDVWTKLYKRLATKSLRRNRLTHSIVLFDPKRSPSDKQLFLAPNVSDPTRASQSFAPGEIITQSELDEMMHVFETLHSDLMAFHQTLPPAVALPKL